jgi:methylmalonyl-CoA mutase
MIGEAAKIIDEVERRGGMTTCVAEGFPKLKIEECAAKKQAAIDSGKETIVGVNKYINKDEQRVETLSIDNTKVRNSQVSRLEELKKTRNGDAVKAALSAVKVAAQDENKNLLEAAIEAARARATLGEITSVMEDIYGRHVATTQVIHGVYYETYSKVDHARLDSVKAKIDAFAKAEGRRPRILVAKMGQDGHDRGAKVISTGFADLGFDVDIGPLFQTPAEVARHAVEADVHVVGPSTQAAGHRTLIPQLIEELKKLGASDTVVIAGGVIPPEDHQALYDVGVAHVFTPGTPVPLCAEKVIDTLLARLKK